MGNLFNKTDETTNCNDKDCPVILHISDMHFGKPMTKGEPQDRQIVFDQFEKTLKKLSQDWKPTYICITGDISDKNNCDGYVKGAIWLANLMNILSIEKDRLFICPGNHDLDRSCAKKIPQPKSESEIDQLITMDRQDEFERPFNRYFEFLEGIGVSKYHYTEDCSQKSFLFGVRFASSCIRFICYSPYFYDWADESKQAVVLGNKPLDWLEGERLIQRRPEYKDISVVLMHCPREHMADSERHSYDSLRPATWHRVATMSHLVLTGHDHHKPEPFDSTGWWAYHSGIGTIYNGIDYGNSFQIIRINLSEQCFEHKPFYWNPGSRSWVEPNDFQKKWPFKLPEAQPESVVPSTEERPSGERAKELAEGLWECIQKRDYSNAEVLWNRDKDWYFRTKDKIHHRWCKQIDQCILEINLMKENS